MAKEIERKFLVRQADFAAMAVSTRHLTQFYLSADPERTVRVRITDDGAWLTIKGITTGMTRDEWEYPLPKADALAMQGICVGRVISKTRYLIEATPAPLHWEVDVFHGQLEGLAVAEIELPSENQAFERPPFVGREVTDDARYYNSAMALSESVPPLD